MWGAADTDRRRVVVVGGASKVVLSGTISRRILKPVRLELASRARSRTPNAFLRWQAVVKEIRGLLRQSSPTRTSGESRPGRLMDERRPPPRR